jgi:hypothetical protein
MLAQKGSCHLRSDLSFQAALEKQVCQRFDVVIGVVIDNNSILAISQITFVDDERRTSIAWEVSCQQSSLSHFIPASTILSSHSMAFKEDRALVSF